MPYACMATSTSGTGSHNQGLHSTCEPLDAAIEVSMDMGRESSSFKLWLVDSQLMLRTFNYSTQARLTISDAFVPTDIEAILLKLTSIHGPHPLMLLQGPGLSEIQSRYAWAANKTWGSANAPIQRSRSSRSQSFSYPCIPPTYTLKNVNSFRRWSRYIAVLSMYPEIRGATTYLTVPIRGNRSGQQTQSYCLLARLGADRFAGLTSWPSSVLQHPEADTELVRYACFWSRHTRPGTHT
jgi:hypothetical protein